MFDNRTNEPGVRVDGRKLHNTQKAVLFESGGQQAWIPLSQIIAQGRGYLVITQWVADTKGLRGVAVKAPLAPQSRTPPKNTEPTFHPEFGDLNDEIDFGSV